MGDDLNKAIENARSWDELREALGRHGYRFEPTERSMKITDGERYAKASGVDERLGRFCLEERFGERLTGRTEGEPQVDRTPPPSPQSREEPLENVRGALSGNGTTKGDASVPGERAAGKAGGRSSVYESLFGKPALERGEATRGGGAGQLFGAAAVAARPVSSEDGEKEVPLRAVEVGLRGAAALTGRSEASRPEAVQPEEKQAGEKRPDVKAQVPEQLVPDRTDATQSERTTGVLSEGKVSPEAGRNSFTDLDLSGPARAFSADQDVSPLPPAPKPDLEVQRLVRDVRAYERAVQAEQDLSAAAGSYTDAELRWKAAQRQGKEVTRLSQTFDRALREAYRDPAAAHQVLRGAS